MIATNPSAFLSAFSFVTLVYSRLAEGVIPRKTDHNEARITPTSELENRCSIQLSYGSFKGLSLLLEAFESNPILLIEL